jgi:hypothetical protein
MVAMVCPALALATEISDPVEFVHNVYRNLAASEPSGREPYTPPDDIYTPRLKALFAADARRAKGEVGCVDFDFWINGQDSELKNVRVSRRLAPGQADRMMVIATFINGAPQEIHFDFQKIKGKWLLDDVHSLKEVPWTLSALLQCG